MSLQTTGGKGEKSGEYRGLVKDIVYLTWYICYTYIFFVILNVFY